MSGNIRYLKMVNSYTPEGLSLFKEKLGRWVGIIAILLSGLIHLYNAPDEYREARYMGILFFLYFVASLASALGIYRGELSWGWILGGLLCIGAIIGYLLSRTVGLPSMEVEGWGPPLAYFSIFLELAFFVPVLFSTPALVRRSLQSDKIP
jgi:hypothetical protein